MRSSATLKLVKWVEERLFDHRKTTERQSPECKIEHWARESCRKSPSRSKCRAPWPEYPHMV